MSDKATYQATGKRKTSVARVTLTPGTVTIAIDGDQMLVHALDREAADGLAEGSMARRVAAFMQPS